MLSCAARPPTTEPPTLTPRLHPAAAAAGIPAGLLRQQERQVLADLGWDLMTPAREVSHGAQPASHTGSLWRRLRS